MNTFTLGELVQENHKLRTLVSRAELGKLEMFCEVEGLPTTKVAARFCLQALLLRAREEPGFLDPKALQIKYPDQAASPVRVTLHNKFNREVTDVATQAGIAPEELLGAAILYASTNIRPGELLSIIGDSEMQGIVAASTDS